MFKNALGVTVYVESDVSDKVMKHYYYFFTLYVAHFPL